MKRFARKPGRRGGFTLTEVAIGSIVLLVLAGTVAESMASMRRSTFTGSARARANGEIDRAIERIVEDMRRSGYLTIGGTSYPHVFQDGQPDAAYDPTGEHTHAPAVENAEPGEQDFGPNQEILFLHPEDLDGDNAPDIDLATGSAIWDSTNEISYTLVTQADGTNVLQRRVTGEAPRTVARGVERIWFDNRQSSGWQLPPGTVALQLWVRAADGSGTDHRAFAEVQVRMRNGGDGSN